MTSVFQIPLDLRVQDMNVSKEPSASNRLYSGLKAGLGGSLAFLSGYLAVDSAAHIPEIIRSISEEPTYFIKSAKCAALGVEGLIASGMSLAAGASTKSCVKNLYDAVKGEKLDSVISGAKSYGNSVRSGIKNLRDSSKSLLKNDRTRSINSGLIALGISGVALQAGLITHELNQIFYYPDGTLDAMSMTALASALFIVSGLSGLSGAVSVYDGIKPRNK